MKTEILKEALFHWKKTFWPFFSCFIEHDKCQEKKYKGPQCTFTIIVQLIRTFVWDLRSRYKQTFQKLAVFTMTKVFGSVFLVLSSVTNLREQTLRVQKVFWQLLWNLKNLFLEPKRLLKAQGFDKRQPFQWKKKFWPFFSYFRAWQMPEKKI